VNWGIVLNIDPHSPDTIIKPFLAKSFQQLLQGTDDVIHISHSSACNLDGLFHVPATKKGIFLLCMTFTLMVPGVPF
jgi:hypothetical protein